MKITSLVHYKGAVFEVVLEEKKKIYLHIDIVTDFHLESGMEIEREQLREIIYASNFRRAYQYALYCLDRRDYSAEELYEKLEEKYKSEKLCLGVIRKLAKADLINDRRYGEKLARKYAEIKKFGYYRCLREMKQKGVDGDLAEELLTAYEGQFYENLRELLNGKYSSTLTDCTDRKAVERVKNSLVRYGYGFDDINRAVREYFEDDAAQG